MQPQSDTEYKELLSEVIKKQIVILGPDITLIKARNVPGLTVADDGTVTTISGEPQAITQALIDQFVQLSGLIVKKTMEPLLMYHPDGTSTSAQPAAAPISVSTPTPTPVPTAPTAQPAPPPMPQGTQPIAPQAAPASLDAQPSVDSVATAAPTSPEIDMDTQKIINEALKQV